MGSRWRSERVNAGLERRRREGLLIERQPGANDKGARKRSGYVRQVGARAPARGGRPVKARRTYLVALRLLGWTALLRGRIGPKTPRSWFCATRSRAPAPRQDADTSAAKGRTNGLQPMRQGQVRPSGMVLGTHTCDEVPKVNRDRANDADPNFVLPLVPFTVIATAAFGRPRRRAGESARRVRAGGHRGRRQVKAAGST